ncbi:urease subunit gamma [Oceanobacillus zhaokaii]|uniref:Urease subunit gamma n=1 Tax=Oceanobacillus zhaokaii TaxID=2052660 RepID=A0A345PLX0_9BACI|nr:urease subunit gamma [Oceanobacillus zhaokaii]AXI11000.1 urease subunit gamma [Oceanobacillus zhaokaii]
MYLTEREKDGLLIVVAANLAKKRRQEGLKLNYPEAVALITYEIMEMARRGGKTIPEIEAAGRKILREEDVMDGVAFMVKQINVEATFPDGTQLVVIYNPIQP